jgi:hypothetical protein
MYEYDTVLGFVRFTHALVQLALARSVSVSLVNPSPSPSLSLSLSMYIVKFHCRYTCTLSSLALSVHAYIPSAEVVKLCHAKINVFLVFHCMVRANIYSVSTLVKHLRGKRTVQVYDPTNVSSKNATLRSECARACANVNTRVHAQV